MSSAKPSPAALSSQKKKMFDRFIPHSVARSLFASDEKSHSNTNYQDLLGQQLLAPKIVPKILNFGDDPGEKENSNPNNRLFQPKAAAKVQKLPRDPYRTLPASYLKDDFYLNLLDWADSGHIAVGLQSSLYLWSGCATRVTKIQDYNSQGDSLCGLKFQTGGNRVILGLSKGDMSILDIGKQRE